jgi:integrase
LIEAALGHALDSATEAAYRRSDALERRRKLMEAWSAYCTKPAAAGQVVPMRRKG